MHSNFKMGPKIRKVPVTKPSQSFQTFELVQSLKGIMSFATKKSMIKYIKWLHN
jgi:hypothetical protein